MDVDGIGVIDTVKVFFDGSRGSVVAADLANENDFFLLGAVGIHPGTQSSSSFLLVASTSLFLLDFLPPKNTDNFPFIPLLSLLGDIAGDLSEILNRSTIDRVLIVFFFERRLMP